MIKITDSFDKQQWDEFVRNHPHGNIFQTFDMAGVYKQTKNNDPISITAVDSESGNILAVVIRVVGGLLVTFPVRSIISVYPLFIKGKEGLFCKYNQKRGLIE